MNSVYVVKRVELIRTTEGSEVTLLWEIGDYNTNDRVVITDPNGQQLFQFIYGNLGVSSGHFIDAGNANQTFGLTIIDVNVSNAGTYQLLVEDKLSSNTTLVVYGRFLTIYLTNLYSQVHRGIFRSYINSLLYWITNVAEIMQN